MSQRYAASFLEHHLRASSRPNRSKEGGGGAGEGNKLEQYIIILKKHGSASLGQRRECNANANANADANATQCNAMQFKQHQNKKNLKL